ncbi:unnamed protein product, partial [Didymodactylos carnosus]
MCWNFEVSLSFAIVHLLSSIYVGWKKPRYYRKFIIFMMCYSCIELLEALQWYVGVEQNLNSSTCKLSNTLLTVVAYILIWIQPIMFSLFSVKGDFRFPLYYSIYAFILALLTLTLGFIHPSVGLQSMGLTEKNNYGRYTCTYMG